MGYANVAQEYRKNAIAGASPLQLVIMLYDGALRFIDSGKAAIGQDLPRQNDQFQRAQRIVMELMATLDMEKGGEVATNLLALYTFALEQLVEANVEDSSEAADRAAKVLSELRESWSELEKQTRSQGSPAEVPLAA